MNTFIIVILCIIAAVILGYLFLIMPRIGKKKVNAPFTEVLYAHRGLFDNSAPFPENSLAAFRRAVKGGYGIELDVQLTKDRVPVVFHDDTLDRVCGVQGKVCEYTWEELGQFRLYGSQEKIPRLEQVLELVSGRVPLIIELKIEYMDVSLCPVVDAVLGKYEGRYCIESFNPMGILWYRRNRPEIMRGQLSEAFCSKGERKGALYVVLENLLFNCVTKPDFIAYNHKHEKKLCRRLCRGLYGNTAVAWTIRSEEELKAAKKHFDMFIFDSFVPKNGSRNV